MASTLIAGTTAVTPSELSFESRQDEPVFLKLDVIAPALPAIDVDFEGFYGDRRVTPKGNGKFLVEIAPLTVDLGTLQGKILIIDPKTGKELAPPVLVTGQIKPWINVKPSRLFLGSIGHGDRFDEEKEYRIQLTSETGPFKIESVEIQDIKSASWTSEPPHGTEAATHVIKVTFRAGALAENVPFGALANKSIVIQTSQPEAPELIVPVMGMISINTTGRDYSQFLYNGKLRWEGPWATPNIAATFLASATILLCGLGSAAYKRLLGYPKWQLLVTVLTIIGMAVGCYFLAKTYSRGGWIALSVGIVALFSGIRRQRFYPMVLAILFALSIWSLPAGMERTTSTSAISEDKSIKHRLLLWQGAMQMMAEHPWNGVGAGQFGNVFGRDYQLATHKASYTTAINDFLTFGAERGIPALTAVVSPLLILIGLGLWNGFTLQRPLLIVFAATILTYLTTCWFSSIVFSWMPSILLIVSIVALTVLLLAPVLRNNLSELLSKFSKVCLVWSSVAVLFAICCVGAANVARSSRAEITPMTSHGIVASLLTPRTGLIEGTILYAGDRKEDEKLTLKNTIRPLAALGWRVVYFRPPKFTSDAISQAHILVDEIRLKKSWPDGKKLLIAGHGYGAQIALASANCMDQTNGVAALMPPTSGILPIALPILECPRSLILRTQYPTANSKALLRPRGPVNDSQEDWVSAVDRLGKTREASP